MVRDEYADDPTESQRRLHELASAATPHELRDALEQLLGFGASRVDDLLNAPPPSRRRPQRSEVVTYRVRVDLQGTKPPVWRRLELASDLFLDELHEFLQVAFGWTDSHLHRFGSGPQYYGRDTEYYLCPWEVDEGEVGVPEHEVRLDEVLVDGGDRLFYNYDFGDDWQHTVKLEAVGDREGGAPRAVCTAGRRAGPPEDCGGVYAFELIVAATDPTHRDHAEGVIDFARHYGEEVDPAMFDLTPFDAAEVNEELADLGIDAPRSDTVLPERLDELLAALRTTPARGRLLRLFDEASLDEPVDVLPETAARMVAAYTWLLERVGDEGIQLTGAGYLPPVHVAAAMDELDLRDEWIGEGNREHLTPQVLNLRVSAQKLGLLRKHRGRLLLTARGRAVRTDPVALWWQLAERMPPRSTDEAEAQAGLVLLVAVAGRNARDLDRVVADVLEAIGWVSGDGARLQEWAAARAAWETKTVLRRLGAVAREDGSRPRDHPTTDGVAFARAALQTWPD